MENNTNNISREAGLSYDQIVRDPTTSRVFSLVTPDGKIIAWMHKHEQANDRYIREIASQRWNCNTCISRASAYTRLSGPDGPLLFSKETFPTGSEQINELNICSKNTCSSNPYEIVLVTANSFEPAKYTSPNGNNQGEFYHWTIVSNVVTDPSIESRIQQLWPKIKSSVSERLLKFLNPDAKATMEIIKTIIDGSTGLTLERPEYWKATCNWIIKIQKQFAKNASELTKVEIEEICIFAMAIGNASGDVHYNFQTSDNFLDFMVMESKEAIALEMDKRSDPRFNQISQLARAKADKGVTNKYGVALVWDGKIYRDDLDIHVETPWGKIYFGKKILSNIYGNVVGKLDFDAGIRGDEAEPVENVSLCDDIVGKSIKIYIDCYTRRTFGDIHCSIVINQLGQNDIVIPVVWPKDRLKSDYLHVCNHTFTAVEIKDPEMSEREARATLAKDKEFTELFGAPTSCVATTTDLINSDMFLIELDIQSNNTNDKINTNNTTDSLAAINEFNSLATKTLTAKVNTDTDIMEKSGKKYLNQTLANRLPTSVTELLEKLAASKEQCTKHNLQIHLPDHVPGYITLVMTSSDKALKTGKSTMLSPCHFEEKSKHPLKPVKQGNARLDKTWMKYNHFLLMNDLVNVVAITKLDDKVFLVLEDATLPTNSADYPLSAGFYPQDLSNEGHKHRSKWAFLNTALNPQIPVTENPTHLAIGTFLTGETATVFLDGEKLVLKA